MISCIQHNYRKKNTLKIIRCQNCAFKCLTSIVQFVQHLTSTIKCKSVLTLSGAVELENLPLKKDALSKLGLPLEVKSGKCLSVIFSLADNWNQNAISNSVYSIIRQVFVYIWKWMFVIFYTDKPAYHFNLSSSCWIKQVYFYADVVKYNSFNFLPVQYEVLLQC